MLYLQIKGDPEMGTINVLFVSAIPLTLQAMQNFFSKDDKISLTNKSYSELPFFINGYNRKFKVIFFDDSALIAAEQEEIKLFMTNNLSERKMLLTAHLDKKYIDFVVVNGIDGIISKRANFDIIKEGIVSVSRGKRFFCKYIKEIISQDQQDKELPQLSCREKEILSKLTEGKNNKKIADELSLSNRTIETYKQRIKIKYKLKSANEIVFLTFWDFK